MLFMPYFNVRSTQILFYMFPVLRFALMTSSWAGVPLQILMLNSACMPYIYFLKSDPYLIAAFEAAETLLAQRFKRAST